MIGPSVGEAFTAGFRVADKIDGRREGKNRIEQLAAQSHDVLPGKSEEDIVLLQFRKGLMQSNNGGTGARVVFEQAAVAFNGAIAYFERSCEAGEGVLEDELLVEPSRQLGAMAHHQVIIELTVGNLVDTGCDKGVELDHPFGLGVLAQAAS